MENEIKLSVIMPCYNVADTLDRALYSILMQKTKYPYEIIVIDDCSTDNTLEKAVEYQKKHSNIKVLKNKTNIGNAKTFFYGLSEAQGDYFCVLDGDDFYTVDNKFQKQLTFLENDIEEEYVATAHHYVIDLGNDEVYISKHASKQEFNYFDCISLNTGGYYHTATYMYRNIFKGNVLGYYNETIFRGDTPRTIFHLMYSNKKVKILNFVGSVYSFHFKGIWSSLSQIEQSEYQIKYFNAFKATLRTELEMEKADVNLRRLSLMKDQAKDQLRKYEGISIERALKTVQKYASSYAFSAKNYVLKNLYYSEYVDSLITTLGNLYRINHPELKITNVNEKNLAIILGVLDPKGGGIFKELQELCHIYTEKSISIFVTNMAELSQDIYDALSPYPHVNLIFPKKGCTDKLKFFHEELKAIAPSKLYLYTSHNDVYGQVLVQKGACKNVVLFSFDHGYICGATNTNIDVIIAKRPVDYQVLKKKLNDKVIYIPTWNFEADKKENHYIPFNEHTALITACGAARYYKIEGGKPYKYIDILISLLLKTKGLHYHFGPIPEEKLLEIRKELISANLPAESFIHIPWSDNIPKFILDHNIDIFIEPFPVVSYKLSLAVLSYGIPIISQNASLRMSTMDFIYRDALRWNYREDFTETLSRITKDDLMLHSQKSLKYFNETHNYNKLEYYIKNDIHFMEPEKYHFADNTFVDVKDFTSLFNTYSTINILALAKSLNAKKTPSVLKNTNVVENIELKKPTKEVKDSKLINTTESREDIELKRPTKEVKDSKPINTTENREERCTLTMIQKIKNKVKKIVPPTISIFMREMTIILREIRKQHSKTDMHYKKLLDKITTLFDKISTLDDKISTLDDKITTLFDKISTLDDKTSTLDDKISTLDDKNSILVQNIKKSNDKSFELTRITQENNSLLLDTLNTKTDKNQLSLVETNILKSNDQLKLITQEILWSEILNNTITNSTWLSDKTFSPGRWAIGYQCIYVIYRILNEIHPKKILELGLGQSTKIIGQYAKAFPNTSHYVVEHDFKWIDLFTKSFPISSNTHLVQLDRTLIEYGEEKCELYAYDGFKEKFQKSEFEFIIIDAPLGGSSHQKYARIDILQLIPNILANDFVLLIDDYNRLGEKNLVIQIEHLLEESGIPYSKGIYKGTKECIVLVSERLKYLTTM